MSHELTLQEIDQFRSDFDNSRNEVVSRAAMRSGVLEASFNPAVTNRLNDVFSVEVETDNVNAIRTLLVICYFKHLTS